jgi:hypothetical protein
MAPRVIQVPKTPNESYNPSRPASSLLKSQVLHLHEALKSHDAEVKEALATAPERLQTEGEVSDYVRTVTRILHPHAGKRQAKKGPNAT